MFPSFLRESRCNEKQDKQEAFIRVISDAPMSAGNPYRLILALLTDTRNISRYLVGHMTQPWETSKFFCFWFLNREALFMTQNTEGNSKSKNSISMTRQFIYFFKNNHFFWHFKFAFVLIPFLLHCFIVELFRFSYCN